MQSPDRKEQICLLESKFKAYEFFFETTILNDEIPARTKAILQDIHKISQQLSELKMTGSQLLEFYRFFQNGSHKI
jgi:hypothetical protein